MATELKFAVFVDYDNIAIGVKNTLNRSFDYKFVKDWLQDRGEILAQIAYGNWNTHSDFKIVSRRFAQHGVQMEHLETAASGSKNGADIALSIDAVELVFTQKHIDAFCILSGDSDFLPLVHKLKKHGKRVYVVAGTSFTSGNLRRNCHEFVSYEMLCGFGPDRYAPVRGRALGQRLGPRPAEDAMPTIRHALRAMERRREIPYIKELRTAVIGLEPDFDERDFGCDAFKDLIYRLVDSGHLRRQPVGDGIFCIAESEFRPANPYDTARETRAGAPRDRRASRAPNASDRGFARPRSAAPARRGSLETGKAVQVIDEAIAKIQSTGRLAELDLLYKTVLEVDPQFRAYGCSSYEFRKFAGQLAMEGYFLLKTSGGAFVLERLGEGRRAAALPATRLGERARRFLSRIAEENHALLQAGMPGKQLEWIVSTQSGFNRDELGVDSSGGLLELAVREGLLNARRNEKGIVQYFSLDAGSEGAAALDSAREPFSPGTSEPTPEGAMPPASSHRAGPGAHPLHAGSPEPAGGAGAPHAQTLDEAVQAACAALMGNKDLFVDGLLRSQLRTALQEGDPPFDLKDFGLRTFRSLLDHAREMGYLETRDGTGQLYFGTKRLADLTSPVDVADDLSKTRRKGLLGWLRH